MNTQFSTQLSEQCKSRLYRMKFETPVDSVAFVMADSREAAWRIGKTVMAVLHSVGIQDVSLHDIRSFRELVRTGVSDDEDLRIFEISASEGQVEEWTRAPYFFTDDASLLGKWAALCADLAASVVRTAIRRAR
ncbi:hypothetical protein AWB71_05168 [Caballeronia peredens]|nr:hypothetical protein AWB71_05168 [Caballeronia peredens]